MKNAPKIWSLLLGTVLAAIGTISEAQNSAVPISISDQLCFETDHIAVISGKSSKDVQTLLAVVRFVDDPKWWVQSTATVLANGDWTVPIYLGEPGSLYGDYLLVIIGDPNPVPGPGQYGSDLPPGSFESDAILIKKSAPGGCGSG